MLVCCSYSHFFDYYRDQTISSVSVLWLIFIPSSLHALLTNLHKCYHIKVETLTPAFVAVYIYIFQSTCLLFGMYFFICRDFKLCAVKSLL